MTIIKRFEPEQQTSKISKKIVIPTVCCLVLLVILEIWVNNALATYGNKLQSISNLQSGLKMENQILENQVAKYAALSDVASASATLGFSKPENIEYIR